MFDYTGCKCPVCQQLFVQGDDVVVCPECGAPYHRDCYSEQKTCVFSDRHGADFEWKPAPGEGVQAEEPDPARTATDTGEAHCPACGAMNPNTALFCESCGVPLLQTNRTATAAPPHSGPATYGPNSVPTVDPFAVTGLPPQFQMKPDEEMDGIPAQYWAAYVGQNAAFYLFNFKRMKETGRKFGACFSAFFFGPLYFLYRKMWLQGGLLLLVNALLSYVPNMLKALMYVGSPLVASLDVDMVNRFLQVGSSLQIFVNFVVGTFAVYWYRQSASKRIKQVLSTDTTGSAEATLARKGGVSLTALFIALGCMMAVSAVAVYFLNVALLGAAPL